MASQIMTILISLQLMNYNYQDIIHHSVFQIKHDILGTLFCTCLQVEPPINEPKNVNIIMACTQRMKLQSRTLNPPPKLL
jgi:hypothetical protein